MSTIRATNQLVFALLIPTLVLSLAARGAGTLPGDSSVARSIQRLPETPVATLADLGNWAGSWRAGVPISLAAAALLAWRVHWRLTTLALLSALLRPLNGLLKSLADSPRPTADVVRVTEVAHGLGFPSGHAMGSMLCYGALFVIAGRLIDPTPLRRGAQAAALALILCTGLGRIWVGAHWPSDVLGGYLWGSLLLVLALRAVDAVAARAGVGHN